MSNEVTTAFKREFDNAFKILTQQKKSKLRMAAQEETISTEKSYFDQIGATTLQKRTSRHGDTPLIEVPHARRQLIWSTWDTADLIDDPDQIRMLVSPASQYNMAMVYAMNRQMDDVVITAAGGDAKTGVDGGDTTSYDTNNTVAVGTTNLTMAKLRAAQQILDDNNVDEGLKRYMVIAPNQLNALLGIEQATSSDYAAIKALVHGEVDTFMGFHFIKSTRLPTSTASTRECLFWAEGGVKLGFADNMKTSLDRRPDKLNSLQILVTCSFGATRMEEKLVGKVNCLETAGIS